MPKQVQNFESDVVAFQTEFGQNLIRIEFRLACQVKKPDRRYYGVSNVIVSLQSTAEFMPKFVIVNIQ